MNTKRYLELLKSSLLHELYIENEAKLLYLSYMLSSHKDIDWKAVIDPWSNLHSFIDLIRKSKDTGQGWYYITEKKKDGTEQHYDLRNVCDIAHSMIGRQRMDHLEWCLDCIRQEDIAGDLIETGICRGGAVIFMRGYLAGYAMEDRIVWAADSFDGVPASRLAEDKDIYLSKNRYPVLAVTLDQVQDIFRRYDLLDDRVCFLKGLFCDTLPVAPIQKLALLRLDGDLYESTMDALNALYSKVVAGGFVIVDDYNDIDACRMAIHTFREAHDITAKLIPIDQSSVYWRK